MTFFELRLFELRFLRIEIFELRFLRIETYPIVKSYQNNQLFDLSSNLLNFNSNKNLTYNTHIFFLLEENFELRVGHPDPIRISPNHIGPDPTIRKTSYFIK